MADGMMTKGDGDTFCFSSSHTVPRPCHQAFVSGSNWSVLSHGGTGAGGARGTLGAPAEGFLLMKFGGQVKDSHSTWAPRTSRTPWPLTKGAAGVLVTDQVGQECGSVWVEV